MNEPLLGCEVAEALSPLDRIFSKWIDLFLACNKSFPQVGESWFNEPGLMSLLCAAAWAIGFPAVAELRAFKTNPGTEKLWPGHADLAVRHDGGVTAFEAKILWLRPKSPISTLLLELENACDEAACLPESVIQQRFGLVFGMYWVPTGGAAKLDFMSTVEEVRKSQPDILAWVLSPFEATENHCPGGIVVGRQSSTSLCKSPLSTDPLFK